MLQRGRFRVECGAGLLAGHMEALHLCRITHSICNQNEQESTTF